ncbi:IclR family transcriptional regulator [Nocardioides sp. NPDC051685]|uniref:IclR family transcriptional regulator n=1 Tax=Nocardioides sp. NPDC051685 TaxID=3364334 RepID=UPI0037B9EA7B
MRRDYSRGADSLPQEPAIARPAGTQTFARGLTALMAIADSPTGLSVQELANRLDVHRSMAYRLIQTLVDFGLVAQASDKTYRPGPRMAAFSDLYLPTLRHIAQPFISALADEVGCAVSLFVAEGSNAFAIASAEPTTVGHHLRFRPGMRTPGNRGAAAYAILATRPPSDNDLEPAKRARSEGIASSHDEVLKGAHAVAAGFSTSDVRACVNVMTYVEEQAVAAREPAKRCAAAIAQALAEEEVH